MTLTDGIRSPDGLVVGIAPATLEFWVQFPNERNQFSTILLPPRGQLCIRYCSNKQQPKLEPATLEFWVRKTGRHPVLKYRVPHGSHFTQSPSPPRSLVRDGQPSPHRSQLVVSRSTCPPLPLPPREQLYQRYCSNKHTQTRLVVLLFRTECWVRTLHGYVEIRNYLNPSRPVG
jgi:hypothetical protein